MRERVHIFYGAEATRAALGETIRVLNEGKKVLFARFLPYGFSPKSLEGVENFHSHRKKEPQFFYRMSEEEHRQYAKHSLRLFHSVLKRAAEEEFDQLFLAEILDAIKLKLIPEKDLATFLEFRPMSLEVVLTGQLQIQGLKQFSKNITRIIKEDTEQ